jgi:hypothetical protein
MSHLISLFGELLSDMLTVKAAVGFCAGCSVMTVHFTVGRLAEVL